MELSGPILSACHSRHVLFSRRISHFALVNTLSGTQSASSDSSWATFGGDTNWSTAGDTKKKPAKALYGGADWDSLTNFDDDLCWAKFEG